MLGPAGGFQPSHVKPLFIMQPLVRLISLVAGAGLTLAPLLLLLSFSYDVGASPYADPKGFKYFALPLLAGVVLGGGLLLVGLPDLVVGPVRKAFRNVAAVLLVVSAAALFHIGFSGSVTAVVCPLAILMNAAAFFYFVYPARRFSNAGGKRAVKSP